jgi:hypothetical protein
MVRPPATACEDAEPFGGPSGWWLGAVAWAITVAGLAAGCGGGMRRDADAADEPWAAGRSSQKDATALDVAPRSGPTTELEAFELDLAVSERRLDAELVQVGAPGSALHRPGGTGPMGEGPPVEPVSPRWATPPEVATAPSPSAPAKAAAPALLPDSACDLACRSLASMRRAADGICRLTSDRHARCVRARERVKGATERLAAAGCGCVAP